MYELLYELPNDLRLRILQNNKNARKPQNTAELWPSGQSVS